MDILTHGISGLAVGTTVAVFSKSTPLQKIKIGLLGAFGAILPDLDAISLWSKFDITFGKALHLTHSGKEIYFSKFWYSHHGFMHSITAPLLFISLSLLISYFYQKEKEGFKKTILQIFLKNKLLYLSFILGFSIHLFEDMPTPSCVWGGVNLFWPFKTYYGGTGHIWWWNNYDIFLIVFSVSVLNIGFHFIKKQALKLLLASLIFLLGFTLCVHQIFSRPFDFNYVGHIIDYYILEKKSQQAQKEILGNKIHTFMKKVDDKIPLNF